MPHETSFVCHVVSKDFKITVVAVKILILQGQQSKCALLLLAHFCFITFTKVCISLELGTQFFRYSYCSKASSTKAFRITLRIYF